MKRFITTKQECQKKINGKGFVCIQCKGIVTPQETVDNSGRPTYWEGCNTCQIFTQGVSKKIYDISEYMVKDRHFAPYIHIKQPHYKSEEMLEYYKSQISGTHRIVIDIINKYKSQK